MGEQCVGHVTLPVGPAMCTELGVIRKSMLCDLSGLVPLLSLFCHLFRAKNKMDTVETFSPGSGDDGAELNGISSFPLP